VKKKVMRKKNAKGIKGNNGQEPAEKSRKGNQDADWPKGQ
jgi:hypothetical protein